MIRKYTVVVEEDSETKKINFDRRNEGFNACELLGILEVLRADILDQMMGRVTDGLEVEHKRVVVVED